MKVFSFYSSSITKTVSLFFHYFAITLIVAFLFPFNISQYQLITGHRIGSSHPAGTIEVLFSQPPDLRKTSSLAK